jgi:hypothetical protein
VPVDVCILAHILPPPYDMGMGMVGMRDGWASFVAGLIRIERPAGHPEAELDVFYIRYLGYSPVAAPARTL